uniref:(northern house mosquito) hypothetical protein n=1 Tax=Culex pipiens TaxID=7175 RepID=A0A8D8IF98_CULPI
MHCWSATTVESGDYDALHMILAFSWMIFSSAPIPPYPERFPNLFRPLSAQISLFLLVQASKQHSDRQLLLLSCGVSLWASKILLTCSRAPHEPNSRLTGTVLRRRKGKITPRKKNGESAAGGGHFFRHVVTFNRNTLER